MAEASLEWVLIMFDNLPRSTFADKPDVPDDVLEDGARLLDIIDTALGADGKALAYEVVALQSLTDALAAANKEWSEAEAADTTYQKLLKETRASGAVLDLELQTFRRSLAQVAGRNDKDFQKLRVERAAQKDDEDDPNAPPPSGPVEPAPTGVTSPKAS